MADSTQKLFGGAPPSGREAAPPEGHPGDYENGHLTRQGMVHSIMRGQSVLHRGRLILTMDQIPGEDQLVEGDPVRRAAAAQDLAAQMADLQARYAALLGPQAPSPNLTAWEAGHAPAPDPDHPETGTERTVVLDQQPPPAVADAETAAQADAEGKAKARGKAREGDSDAG